MGRKYKSQSFILLTLALWLCVVQTQQQNKLSVIVLYESLCPDSVRFMARQLGPSYAELKDFIDIKLVPFGNSFSQNSGEQFFCQHGPRECEGNRLQSCVLNQTDDQEKQVNFAVCQMVNAPNKAFIKYCAESTGLSSDIDSCQRTDLGTQLQLEAERITHSYSPSFIPTIVFDQVFDQQLQDRAMRDFRGTVCRLLQQRQPAPLTICQ